LNDAIVAYIDAAAPYAAYIPYQTLVANYSAIPFAAPYIISAIANAIAYSLFPVD
jgi:hypothetical protein